MYVIGARLNKLRLLFLKHHIPHILFYYSSIIHLFFFIVIEFNNYSPMFKILITTLLVLSVFSAYTPKIAKKLSVASAACYESATKIESWTCDVCSQLPLKNTRTFQGNVLDIFGYTGYSEEENAIIVAFRGTVDIQNWIANLDAQQVNYPGCSGCLIHEGFYNAFQTVEGYVRKQIQILSAQYRNAKIYVTGFSLGGALATIAALDIKDIFGKVDQFYSFGQPRVGNQYLATQFSNNIEEHYRVIHYADIVPHLPPQIPIPYSHFAYEIWYTQNMQSYKQCGAEEFKCSKSLLPFQWSTTDNDINAYMKLAVNMENLRWE